MKRVLVSFSIAFSVASGALSYALFLTNSELRSALAAQNRGYFSENVAQTDSSVQKEISQIGGIKKVEEAKTERAAPPSPEEQYARHFKQTYLEDPERRRMFIARDKRHIEKIYAALFKKLNLSEEEAEIFMSLLSEKRLYERGLRALVSDDEKAVVQANLDALDAGLTDLLGEQGISSYKEYETSLPQRQAIENLARKLSYSRAPLSEETAENLIAMMASQESSFNFTNDFSGLWKKIPAEISQEDVDTYLNERNELNTQILESAREILNADQLDALLEQQLDESEQIQQWSRITAQDRAQGRGTRLRPPRL